VSLRNSSYFLSRGKGKLSGKNISENPILLGRFVNLLGK